MPGPAFGYEPVPSSIGGVRLAAAAAVLAVAQIACSGGGSSTLPRALSDEAFWNVSLAFSEPAGAFTHSENLLSNERNIAGLSRMLDAGGGVYVGVGPEQNFTYIAALDPSLAFIVDIREENRSLHLMYKALFELSDDRAGFVSRLFSREPLEGVTRSSSVDDLFAALERARPDEQRLKTSVAAIRERLVERHRWPVTDASMDWINHALETFHAQGPDIHYAPWSPGEPRTPSYRSLMTARDLAGVARSYLASEESFALIKDLQAKNLIVPLVGDFSGPNAIRRIGEYVRTNHAIVTAFYASNVEVYLTRQKLARFCGNLAALPHGSRSWFVGSKRMEPLTSKLKSCGVMFPPG
jgi:hypothetical protein